MFDGLHVGHTTLLAALADEGRKRHLQTLVVTFDHHPRSVVCPDRAPALLQTSQQRIDSLCRQPGIDAVLPLTFTPALADTDSADFLRLLTEHYGMAALMMGYNHRLGHDRATFAEVVANAPTGIDVVKAPEYLGPQAPVSSTLVRSLLAAGRVADAMHCLGRPYALHGTVVAGFHNGRGIGFPTANVGNIPPELLLPHNGAYAVLVRLPGETLKQGMVNIGTRPTLDNGHQLSVEVNIFDFDRDIYGQPISLLFVGFLRLEFKMCSVDDLRQQLSADRDRAKQILNDYLQNPLQ